MRKSTQITSILIAIALSACQPHDPSAEVASKQLLHPRPAYKSYPHSQQAFTQGLVYHEGVLYEGTGKYGESSLRRVEIETGKVLKQRKLAPRYFGEGLTIFEGKIYQLTWKAKICFVYDLETFSLQQRFSYDTQGWGLTHDGSQLIMSDGSSYLYFRDPSTFAETKRVQVRHKGRPIDQLNELEYVEGEVLANIWYEDRIARIDPNTGEVKGFLDFSHLLSPSERRRLGKHSVLNGIAYNPKKKTLYLTGKNWPKLFEVPHSLDN